MLVVVMAGSDLEVMVGLSRALEQEYESDGADPWASSDFRWLRGTAPARRGAIGKEMFRRWARQEGFDVQVPAVGQPADCVVDGLDVVVKFGMLWANGGFTFEQIRHQAYDAVALLALEPHDVHLWVVPLEELWTCSTEQHGPDTHWLSFGMSTVPAAVGKYGGDLTTAGAALLEQTRRKLGGE